VEDDPNDALLVTKAFQKTLAGIPLHVVPNGQEAVSLAASLSPIAGAAPAPQRAAPSSGRSRPARRAWRWGAGGALVAVAAAWLVWVGGRAGDGNGTGRSGAPLPAFEIDATGGDRQVRGPAPSASSGAARVLRPESRLELTLRPATAVPGGAISVDAYLAPAGGEGSQPHAQPAPTGPQLEPVALPFAISGAGVAHLAGNAGQLFGARRGRWQLRLLVARADLPPAQRARLAAGAATAGPGWQRMAVELSLVDPR